MVSEEKLPERVVLGEVLGFVYGGLSAVESRTVRRCFWLGDTDCRLSVGIEVLYSGPSAAEGRTIRVSRKMPRNSSAKSRYY